MSLDSEWKIRERIVGQTELAKKLKALWKSRGEPKLPQQVPTPAGLEFTKKDGGFSGKDRDDVAKTTQGIQGNS